MLKLVVISILLVGIAVLLLGVRIFTVKNGKFPSAHAHSSEQLRKRGIGCHKEL